MPFLADELWRNLVAGACEGAPDSVHLAGWPEVAEPDEQLLAEVDEVRRIVRLARQARDHAGIKHRQPLRRAVVYGAANAAGGHIDEMLDELRVKELALTGPSGKRVRLKPNLPVLGPRLGPRLPAIRKALEEERWEWEGENVRVDGELLVEGEVLTEREAENEGFAFASDGDMSVEIDPELDDELRLEGRVLDLTHAVNVMRREQGLEITDRIVLTLPESDRDLLRFEDQIKAETLATQVRMGDSLEIDKA
jgi:isoleucyl-tRNA synthetase